MTDAEHAAVLRPLMADLEEALDSADNEDKALVIVDATSVRAAIERAIELLEANDAEWIGPAMGSA